MARISTRRTLHLWIACCAILMNALAPSVSHAVAGRQGRSPAWAICRVAPAGGDAASQRRLAQGREKQVNAGLRDCGYCLAHAGTFGLIPGPLYTPDVSAQRPPHCQPCYRSPTPLMAWSAARPRGPPAFV